MDNGRIHGTKFGKHGQWVKMDLVGEEVTFIVPLS